MIEIHPLNSLDIEKVVNLHRKSLPETLSSRIGKEYLYLLYNSLINHHKSSEVIGAFEGRQLIGVVSISYDLECTQKEIAKNMKFKGYIEILKSLSCFRISILELIKHTFTEFKIKSELVDNSVYITTFFVDSKFRRRGIGRNMINFLLQNLKESGLKSLYVDTDVANSKAQSFYEANGFKLQKTICNAKLYKFKP